MLIAKLLMVLLILASIAACQSSQTVAPTNVPTAVAVPSPTVSTAVPNPTASILSETVEKDTLQRFLLTKEEMPVGFVLAVDESSCRDLEAILKTARDPTKKQARYQELGFVSMCGNAYLHKLANLDKDGAIGSFVYEFETEQGAGEYFLTLENEYTTAGVDNFQVIEKDSLGPNSKAFAMTYPANETETFFDITIVFLFGKRVGGVYQAGIEKSSLFPTIGEVAKYGRLVQKKLNQEKTN